MHILQLQPATERIRATVFDIPLLVDLIARHLTTHDVYKCTLVSRQFHDAFQHCLYTCISIAHFEALEKFTCKEAVSAFSNHLSYVREVSTPLAECIMHLVKGDHLQCAPPHALRSTSVLFKNLVDFRYYSNSFVYMKDIQQLSTSILLLLEATPALQVLHLTDFAIDSDALILRLAKIIREKGRRLKEFRLENLGCIPQTHLFTLLWSCAAVEVLYVGMSPEFCESTVYSADTLSGLRALAREALSSKGTRSDRTKSEAVDLTESSQGTDKIEFAWKELTSGGWLIGSDLEMILELFQKCPFLERTTVPRLNEQDIIKRLAPIMAKTMPQLRHLSLRFINDQPLGSCSLVQSCKNLISLKMERMQFDSRPLVDAVVLGHGHSLQELYLERSVRLSSQELNLILNNCPRLKCLYALAKVYNIFNSSPILDTDDMAMVPEKPGWSCKDLETLQLCYNGMGTPVGIPEVLWRQVGQLSKLRDLRLHRHDTCEGPPVHEKESVRQAVLSWMALPDLRRLELRRLNAFTDEALVIEVESQRPELEWVRYTYD